MPASIRYTTDTVRPMFLLLLHFIGTTLISLASLPFPSPSHTSPLSSTFLPFLRTSERRAKLPSSSLWPAVHCRWDTKSQPIVSNRRVYTEWQWRTNSSISMPVACCRHVVGKTLTYVVTAIGLTLKLHFVGKSPVIRTFSLRRFNFRTEKSFIWLN